MENKKDEEIKLLEYIHKELNEQQRFDIEKQIAGHEETRVLFTKLYHEHLTARWGLRASLIRGNYSSFKAQFMSRDRQKLIVVATAAAVILFACMTIIFLNDQPGQQEHFVPGLSEIQPGSSQATLTLSSGLVISIADLKTEIQEQDGSSIRVKQNGMIEYPQLDSADSVPSNLIMNHICTPRGGEFIVTLSDGSIVWLNADSRIDFPVQFTGKQREVYLTRGEAYFAVAKDTQKPFIVHMHEDVNVKVYGTEFYANTRDPYAILAVLVNGSVGFMKGTEQQMLVPNQKAEYKKDINKIIVTDTDVAPYIAWKDGNFIFNNETLESIMSKLSLWYDFDVFYANDELRDIRLSGDMKKYDKVESLLYFFEQISNVKFTIKGKCLTVDYK